MDTSKTALERAFEMAQSGRFATVTEIRHALAAEGYGVTQLMGRTLRRQLVSVIQYAKFHADRTD